MFSRLAAALCGLVAFATPAAAQTWPTGPVRLIVSTGAGAAPDVIARIVGDALQRRWGQQVIVANHPGAAGALAMKIAGTAPPDGSTLLFGLSSNFVALPEIAETFPYDLVRDFAPVGFVVEQPIAFSAAPSLGASTLPQFIDYVKKRPNQINAAVLSHGGISHLAAEWVNTAGGLDMTMVHYPGAPQGLNDLMGGRVHAISDGLPSLAGAIDGGALKLLAVGSERRLSNMPNVPTIAEALPGVYARGFFAIMATPGTPEAITKKASEDLNAVMREPSMIKKLEEIASYTNPMSPAELLAYVKREREMWRPVIEKVGMKK
jgi:tripartite-type tricarboxylate transporter receptor subunit TctC